MKTIYWYCSCFFSFMLLNLYAKICLLLAAATKQSTPYWSWPFSAFVSLEGGGRLPYLPSAPSLLQEHQSCNDETYLRGKIVRPKLFPLASAKWKDDIIWRGNYVFDMILPSCQIGSAILDFSISPKPQKTQKYSCPSPPSPPLGWIELKWSIFLCYFIERRKYGIFENSATSWLLLQITPSKGVLYSNSYHTMNFTELERKAPGIGVGCSFILCKVFSMQRLRNIGQMICGR